MGTWLNADGLYVKLGADEARRTTGGKFSTPYLGGTHVVEVEFDVSTGFSYYALGATTATPTGAASGTLGTTNTYILADNVIIPKNAQIEFVELLVETAFNTNLTGTVDIGLCKLDRTTAVGGSNALIAGIIGTSNLSAVGNKFYFQKGSTATTTLPALLSATGASGATIGANIGSDPCLLTIKFGTADLSNWTAATGHLVIRVCYRSNYTTSIA